jgi:large subunit ribosomal protein L29
MKYAELKNKSEKQLRDVIAEKRAELRDLRFKVSGGALKNISAIREAKRVIARALTVLNAPTPVKPPKEEISA